MTVLFKKRHQTIGSQPQKNGGCMLASIKIGISSCLPGGGMRHVHSPGGRPPGLPYFKGYPLFHSIIGGFLGLDGSDYINVVDSLFKIIINRRVKTC